VTTVRQLEPSDVEQVVERIQARLAAEAARQPFVNPVISHDFLADSLRRATASTWVAEDGGRIAGHLYGALLENESHGQGVWIGPDGASFDDLEVLSDLYGQAGASWIDSGALEHYVWTLDEPVSTQPWHELGFARVHRRGVLALPRPPKHPLPRGYAVRRGGLADLDLAVALDDELDGAERLGPSFSIGVHNASKRDDFCETLDDPEVHHYVVEHEGRGVAQCITFPLPARRGSFDATLHLSAVTVLGGHRGRGVATAMVDHALSEAHDAGFTYAETNWRVTNRNAQRYWLGYGFEPTYVRLHRTIGSG
jgi:GNAT superfamily N-acetyltransferase